MRPSRYLGRALWRRWSGYLRRSRVETKPLGQCCAVSCRAADGAGRRSTDCQNPDPRCHSKTLHRAWHILHRASRVSPFGEMRPAADLCDKASLNHYFVNAGVGKGLSQRLCSRSIRVCAIEAKASCICGAVIGDLDCRVVDRLLRSERCRIPAKGRSQLPAGRYFKLIERTPKNVRNPEQKGNLVTVKEEYPEIRNGVSNSVES